MPIPLEDDRAVTIRAMRLGGYTTKDIAEAMSVSLSTVSKYCLSVNETRGHKRAYTRTSRGNDAVGTPQPGNHTT
jgi:transposase